MIASALFLGVLFSHSLTGTATRQICIPHIAVAEVWRTDLLLDNPSGQPIALELQLYSQGQAQEARSIELPAFTQVSLPLTIGECGFVQSSAGELVCRLSYRHQVDQGVAEFILQGQACSRLSFLRGDSSTVPDWAGLAYMNVHDAQATVSLTAYDHSGKPLAVVQRTLGPWSRDVVEWNGIFPEIELAAIARLEAISPYPMSGLTLSGLKGSRVLLFTPAVGRLPAGVYFLPHIAADTQSWGSTLLLDNTTEMARQVSLTLFSQGQEAATFELAVDPGASLRFALSADAEPAQAEAGYLLLKDEGIIPRASFRHQEGGACEFLLSQSESESLAFCLPNPAAELNWRGLAIANVSPGPIIAALHAYHQGQAVATSILDLPGHTRQVHTLELLFGGKTVDQVIAQASVSSGASLAGLCIAGAGGERLLFSHAQVQAQPDPGQLVGELYYPGDDSVWQRADPAGWDEKLLEQALTLAEDNRSSALLVLLRGRILAERIWRVPSFPRTGLTEWGQPQEDVASVQKSLSSLLATIARDRGLLDIERPVSTYLGPGWSKASATHEQAILVRHLLSMTSGLNERFEYVYPVGSFWQYNTPVYAVLHEVLESAGGKSLGQLTTEWLTRPLAMKNSYWVNRPAGSENDLGLVACVRDLARLGLLVQSGGAWRGASLLKNPSLLLEAVSPSQTLNQQYGYLWWLNRQRLLLPTAPADLIAAQGANGRRIWIVPSLGLVVTRTGASPSPSFERDLWALLTAAQP
jgi:hypothetical protein